MEWEEKRREAKRGKRGVEEWNERGGEERSIGERSWGEEEWRKRGRKKVNERVRDMGEHIK